MKPFIRPLFLAVAASATAIGISLVLSAWAQHETVNCYNSYGDGGCTSQYCTPGLGSTQTNYCKQLSVPYSDPGCCSYVKTVTIWANKGGVCPCNNQSTITISQANNNADFLCNGNRTPINTEQLGSCAAPQSSPGS